MHVKDLKPNKNNPRTISGSRLTDLTDSLEKYGDLSGTVFNRRSKQLVSGHQRSKGLPPDAKIIIEKKYDAPTKTGTVAEGYIEANGEKYKFREVDWDETMETEALLAANGHGGEWDHDILKLTLKNMPKIDIRLTGIELKKFNIELPKIEVKREPKEQTDKQYLKANPGSDTEVVKEQIPSMINTGPKGNVFQSINETRDIIGKKHVIIIELPTNEKKIEVKDQIKIVIEKNGGKFI